MITRKAALTGTISRGPTKADADFTLAATAVDNVISSGGTTEQTVNDAVYTTYNPATIDHEWDIQLAETVQGTLDDYTLESLDTDVAIVDQYGRVTRVSDGTARILCHTRLLNRRVDVAVSREGGTTTQQFKEFATGSLAKECTDAVDSRIAGVTPSTAKSIYTTQNHGSGIYTRNASCWCADLDLTCISPWNSTGANKRAGTLITPRHVLFAWHYQIGAGATIRFVQSDNTVVTRTVSSVQSVSGAGLDKDITIGRLDSDVSAGISYAKLLPANYASYLPGLSNGIPCLGLDQEEKALVCEWVSTTSCRYPSTADRQALNESLISGDSGNPLFAIIGGELVLLTVWTYGGAGSGTELAANITAINDTITSLGGGGSVTTVNLSSYPSYG